MCSFVCCVWFVVVGKERGDREVREAAKEDAKKKDVIGHSSLVIRWELTDVDRVANAK
jgi:hypothetical protein